MLRRNPLPTEAIGSDASRAVLAEGADRGGPQAHAVADLGGDQGLADRLRGVVSMGGGDALVGVGEQRDLAGGGRVEGRGHQDGVVAGAMVDVE